ncbi:MAG TPA: SRPBCC domain-containing protein [Egibacteraceae bacterium]|nr:SRPBCC domain-containing protein [Egibacteraceae bacterium]
MKTIETEIHIDASASRVWGVLVDLERYRDWNPFVVEASGSLSEDARISVRIRPEGKRATAFRPRVVALEPERRLAWLGHLGIRGVFDGEHSFELHPAPGAGTRFVQRERFTGILARPLLRWIAAPTRDGFEAMNAALKTRAERPVMAG